MIFPSHFFFIWERKYLKTLKVFFPESLENACHQYIRWMQEETSSNGELNKPQYWALPLTKPGVPAWVAAVTEVMTLESSLWNTTLAGIIWLINWWLRNFATAHKYLKEAVNSAMSYPLHTIRRKESLPSYKKQHTCSPKGSRDNWYLHSPYTPHSQEDAVSVVGAYGYHIYIWLPLSSVVCSIVSFGGGAGV